MSETPEPLYEIDLDLVKAHLRIDHDTEDAYLRQLGAAAARYAGRFLGYAVPAEPDEDVIQALLLIIGHWYANREEVVTGIATSEVPFAARCLLWGSRRVPM